MGARAEATPKATSRPKTKPEPEPEPEPATKSQPKPKAQRKRHQWSAAEKAAIGKRMKAYWAKQRKAKG